MPMSAPERPNKFVRQQFQRHHFAKGIFLANANCLVNLTENPEEFLHQMRVSIQGSCSSLRRAGGLVLRELVPGGDQGQVRLDRHLGEEDEEREGRTDERTHKISANSFFQEPRIQSTDVLS